MIDFEPFEVGQDTLTHVVSRGLNALFDRLRGGKAFILQEVGKLLHFGRVGPTRVKERAARAIDCARILTCQGDREPFDALGIVEVDVCQPFPAAANAGNLMPVGRAAINNILDDGVQTGNIAASRQDADFLSSHGIVELSVAR